MKNIKKITNVFAIILVVIFSMSADINSKKIDYFQQIRIDNMYSIKGIKQINSKTNCYQFIYNDAGKLIKIKYPGSKKGKLDRDPYFGVAQIEIKYFDGYEQRTYLNTNERPMRDNINGVFGIRIKLDKNDRPISIFNCNKYGETMNDKYGVAQYLWTLDEKGRRIKSIRLDKSGRRVIDKEGFYELRAIYDEKGNLTEQLHYTEKGQLVTLGNTVARIKYRWDATGNLVEIKYLGSDGQLQENKASNIAVIKSEYDDQGCLIKQGFYGTDEQLKAINGSGNFSYAVKRLVYDKYGTLKKIYYYDIDGKVIRKT